MTNRRTESEEIKLMLGIQCDIAQIREIQIDVANEFGLSRPNLGPHITMLKPIKTQSFSTEVYQRVDALSDFVFNDDPFETVFKGFDHFFGNVIILDILANKAFNDFSARFNTAMENAGIKLGRFERERHPHITLVKEFKGQVVHYDILDYVNEKYCDIIGQTIPINSVSVYAKDKQGWDMVEEMEMPTT